MFFSIDLYQTLKINSYHHRQLFSWPLSQIDVQRIMHIFLVECHIYSHAGARGQNLVAIMSTNPRYDCCITVAANTSVLLCNSFLKLMHTFRRPIRPCFVDSLFPVTRPHPLRATASKIIIELACYESH